LKPGLRPLAPIAAFVLFAAGCTGAERERDLPDVELPSATGSPAAGSPSIGAGVPDAPGRIAVLDEGGNLVTFEPDGSDAVVLAESVEGESLVRQPTWSPDGERIAWVRFDVGGGEGNALVTTAPDGTMPTEASTTVIPFYLFWDPTSSRIAYLGSSAEADIELGILDVAAAEAVALGAGSPFYLSWNPAGDELFVHVGGDRLDRLEIDGTLTTVHDRPGAFDVPVWTSDGRSLVYASETRNGQRLVAHDLEADRVDELVRFDEAITFVVSPDGAKVAYQVLLGPNDVGPLVVLDRETGAVEEVATGFVPAYFWSPQSTKLLYLFPDVAPEGAWFRWGVWDGESSFTTPRFLPSEVFVRDYLQFFQQYAQSMTLWAPDGSAFTYAGTSESGASGAWIQPAGVGVEPILMTDGVFAEWSPA
jgi:TolB protein